MTTTVFFVNVTTMPLVASTVPPMTISPTTATLVEVGCVSTARTTLRVGTATNVRLCTTEPQE